MRVPRQDRARVLGSPATIRRHARPPASTLGATGAAARGSERSGSAVLGSGHYILGPEVEAFEREFADYCGAAHAVGVANGTETHTIALRAMGVGPGDEVVVPSFTFYASAEAIPTGATPSSAISPDTYCVTAATVKAALTRARRP